MVSPSPTLSLSLEEVHTSVLAGREGYGGNVGAMKVVPRTCGEDEAASRVNLTYNLGRYESCIVGIVLQKIL